MMFYCCSGPRHGVFLVKLLRRKPTKPYWMDISKTKILLLQSPPSGAVAVSAPPILSPSGAVIESINTSPKYPKDSIPEFVKSSEVKIEGNLSSPSVAPLRTATSRYRLHLLEIIDFQ